MDAGDIFSKSSSIPRVVNLTYEDTGLPIDTDDLDDIRFSVIHAVTTRELDEFALGDGTVTVLNSVSGQVRFIVPHSVSATAKRGTYYVLATTEETDVAYEDNIHVRKGLAFCFQIR